MAVILHGTSLYFSLRPSTVVGPCGPPQAAPDSEPPEQNSTHASPGHSFQAWNLGIAASVA